MNAKAVIFVVFLAVSADCRVFFNKNDDRLYYAGGPLNNFTESLTFCQEFGHEMMGWFTETERYMMQYGLLRDTVQEHWMNSTIKGDDVIWSDGTAIRSFFWIPKEPSCRNSSCHVTGMSNGGVNLRTRDSGFKARNICVIQTTRFDVLQKLDRLWAILDREERVSLTADVPGLMILVNARHISSLQAEVDHNDQRIAQLEKALHLS